MSGEPQVMNGPAEGMSGRFIDSVDPDDPEHIRQMRRPAEVKEDLNQMEHRKRVDAILRSAPFKQELEHIVADQLKQGGNPTSLLALQQISELLVPHSRSTKSMTGPVIPILDMRGVDSLNYSKAEKLLRCKVAACYRLVDLYGWANNIYNLISVRIGQDYEHFLISPYGLLYNEVTSGSLCKVDMQGDLLDPGSTTLGSNTAAFALHSAIHAARPDIKAAIHITTPNAVAVSIMKQGLMPISHEAIVVGECSYFDYTGALDDDERDIVCRALGPRNKVLFLRNHGFVACGSSIEEAWFIVTNVMAACETQVRAAPIGLENLQLATEEVQRRVQEKEQAEVQAREESEDKRKWRRGEMEYEALMRHLDNAGYRTGYLYREPVHRGEQKRDRMNAEVELPPTATNYGHIYDDENGSPHKQHLDRHKKAFKSEWLATPNQYQKEEIEETGTPNPKKITKWKPGEAGSVSTPIKVDTPNQFAPQGVNPKELREKHQKIRADYYTEKVSAGPQSRILEGMTWEEAQKFKDGQTTSEGQTIVVGAASKGIIQRQHQHNAVVYQTYYASNPFDNMSEEEIAKYKADVERKNQGGEPELLEPGPDGRLISTEERMQQVRGDVVEEAVNGEKGHPAGSPTKSTTSTGEDTLDDRSSREGSPTKELPDSSKGEKKKKKFRMPSFSKTKKDKKAK